MNRTELRLIIKDYEVIANRLFRADYYDYINVLKKYISFLESTEITKDYIDRCGGYDENTEDDFNRALNNRRLVFALGDTESEEVRTVFSMLKFISRKYETVPLGILNKYSSANKFNDMLDAFNDRVVSVLNMYITNYLSKEGIKMKLDDNTSVVINNSGQFNVANDNSTINATQNNGIKAEDVTQLIDAMRAALAEDISDDDRETANDSMDIIQDELLSEQPNEKNVRSHFKILSKIDGGVKFTSACCALLTFADKVYPFLGQLTALFPH